MKPINERIEMTSMESDDKSNLNENILKDIPGKCNGKEIFITSTSSPLAWYELKLMIMDLHLLGSIAEREHKKWENAIDLPNNPYSAEALQRRLSQTSPKKSLLSESLLSLSPTKLNKMFVIHSIHSFLI